MAISYCTVNLLFLLGYCRTRKQQSIFVTSGRIDTWWRSILCRSIVSAKATATYHKIWNWCFFPELYQPNSTRVRPLHQDPLTKACGRTYGTNLSFLIFMKYNNYRQSFSLRECTWTECVHRSTDHFVRKFLYWHFLILGIRLFCLRGGVALKLLKIAFPENFRKTLACLPLPN